LLCCNIHGLILYLAKVALVAVELCEFGFGFLLVFFLFFISSLHLCRLASVLLRCRLFLPWDPAGSNTITVESLMSQLIWNTIQTKNKKQQPQENSLNIFTEQIFTGQLFSLTITSLSIFCSLCFYFLTKNKKKKRKERKKPAIWKAEWFPWWS